MADELTEKVIGAAIEVHRILGPGLLERIYRDALCIELELRGMRVAREMDVTVRYKDHELCGQRVDLLVEGELIVEIKALSQLPEVAMAQVISYLKATGLKRGLLINFSQARLIDGVKRISV